MSFLMDISKGDSHMWAVVFSFDVNLGSETCSGENYLESYELRQKSIQSI